MDDAQLTSLRAAILRHGGGAVYGTLVVRNQAPNHGRLGVRRGECLYNSQYGNGRAKLQKNFAFCEKFEGIGLAFAAASALLAGRRGELQRAGENSRCWEILRADASRHLPDDRTDWRCNSRTRVYKMKAPSMVVPKPPVKRKYGF